MATTVRLDDDVKAELDKVQGLLQAETGERLTHSELLARLLGFARRHEAELLAEGTQTWRPPTRRQLDALFAKVEDWGVDTDVTRIDEELYS